MSASNWNGWIERHFNTIVKNTDTAHMPLLCWGSNRHGQLGCKPVKPSPSAIHGGVRPGSDGGGGFAYRNVRVIIFLLRQFTFSLSSSLRRFTLLRYRCSFSLITGPGRAKIFGHIALCVCGRRFVELAVRTASHPANHLPIQPTCSQ